MESLVHKNSTIFDSSLGPCCMCQIERIMRQYKAVLVERDDVPCPNQILLFSSCWTEKLRTFADEYMCRPLFVIASPMEISYYGRVHQVANMYCRFLLYLRFLPLKMCHALFLNSSNDIKWYKCLSYDPSDGHQKQLHILIPRPQMHICIFTVQILWGFDRVNVNLS